MHLNDSWMEENGFVNKNRPLGEVLTVKEIEVMYNLPLNTVVQDIRRGKVNSKHFRQSGKIWLVTRAESNRLYSNYKIRNKKPRQTG